MTNEKFLAACKRLVKKGWQARLESGRWPGIRLKRPGGRDFCFNPIAAVYTDRSGKAFYYGDLCDIRRAIERLGGISEEIEASMKGMVCEEGDEQICLDLYQEMLEIFDLTAKRACFKCGDKIRECMGFVVARDVLRLISGESKDIPRELCAKCAVGALSNPRPFLSLLDQR